jgi:hypothetical protein
VELRFAGSEQLEAASRALAAHGFVVELLDDVQAARIRVAELIPAAASVFTAASETLRASGISSGSQLPAYAGGAGKAICVVGSQKLVPDSRVRSATHRYVRFPAGRRPGAPGNWLLHQAARSHGSVNDHAWQSALDAGWSAEELAETFGFIGLTQYVDSFLNYARTELDVSLQSVAVEAPS